jgi:pimeloyl-ACP methyl ester carboxylesterase
LVGKALITLAALGGLTALITLWLAAAHEREVEATYPPEGQFVMVDGRQVHAVVRGNGPDLVMIHGSNGNTHDMSFALAPALEQHFRVILFDRPGLGYSDAIPGGGSITQQADVLRRAAHQLGADTPIVLGQSYGGAVALAWAVKAPKTLSGLVLVSAPGIPWETPLDPVYRVTSHPIGSAFAVPLITAFVPDRTVINAFEDVFAPQAVPETFAEYFGVGLSLRRGSMRANAKQRANLLAEISALAPQYGSIAVPTSIVHGTADTTVNYGLHAVNLAKRIPQAQLHTLQNIGHMPHHVATPDVVAAIEAVAQRADLR